MDHSWNWSRCYIEIHNLLFLRKGASVFSKTFFWRALKSVAICDTYWFQTNVWHGQTTIFLYLHEYFLTGDILLTSVAREQRTASTAWPHISTESVCQCLRKVKKDPEISATRITWTGLLPRGKKKHTCKWSGNVLSIWNGSGEKK